MPVKVVTTAGTRVALLTATEGLPSTRFAKSVTITLKPGMTGVVYIGFPAPINVGVLVSSTVYDVALSVASLVISFTYAGNPEGGGGVDLASIYLDSSVNGEGVSFTVGHL